ncbi:alpha/beta fold hydrolase [Comamonas endophytica]|uniref:Alpha/beta hydrolase n=1 Tax=Comamonas endophytica TaxID=2949090 RepID=A0ABY6GAX8_9BURK|nr:MULTISPECIES: alpha/beta hydrolase [unclassified Acidovorax]MCD2513923.1 alpha/beta hydrolase [Acidovorax sp. D4N7]UYG52083.1 alpha/beta hydrolase [Acidovorax sp. 5MLIR]
MYDARRPSRSEHLPLRGIDYHVRVWEGAQADGKPAPLVLLHGWMDVGASYQFVVDAFSAAFMAGRSVIAPDWRGFGLTRPREPVDHYPFVDYLADLDQLLDHYAPGRPVDLVGHSMGGNVAMLYAGVRPARIRRLVNLEGFGLAQTSAGEAPARHAQWLDEMQALARGELDLKPYDSVDGVAQRLRRTNCRLDADKARWLAQHWAAADAQGRWHILGDAAHKVVNPYLFRVEEVLAIYAAITAPTLAVEAAGDSLAQWYQGRYTLDEYHARLQHVRDCRTQRIEDAGHMLHHDQPQAVAGLIEEFLH